MTYCFLFNCENKRKWESTFLHLHPVLQIVHLSFPSRPLSSKIFLRSVNGDSENLKAPRKSLQVILGAPLYLEPQVKFVSNCWLSGVQNMFITKWLLAFLFVLFWPIMLRHDFSIFSYPMNLMSIFLTLWSLLNWQPTWFPSQAISHLCTELMYVQVTNQKANLRGFSTECGPLFCI